MDQGESLRRLYRTGELPPAVDAHPSPDELDALARGEGDEHERLRRLDHVMACATCREELELLRAIAGAERREVRALSLPRWLPVAAGLLLVVGATVLWPRFGGEDPLRDAGRGNALLVLPVDGARVAPGRFVWHRVEGAESYRFELVQDDGVVAVARETTDTTLLVGDSSVVAGGGDYRWWVTAFTRDGRRVRSETRRLLRTAK
jgi:hypothetical protein